MKIILSKKKSDDFKGVKVFFYTSVQIKDLIKKLKKTDNDIFSCVLRKKRFSGEKDEIFVIPESEKKSDVILIGLGDSSKLIPQDFLKIAASVVRKVKHLKSESIAFDMLKTQGVEESEILPFLIQGFLLGGYEFNLKTGKNKKKNNPDVHIFSLSKDYDNILKEQIFVCEAVNYTRDLVNENAGVMTPLRLTKEALLVAKEHKLKCTVLDDKALEKNGLRLLRAVGQGAVNKPCLIMLEYLKGSKKQKKIAYIGKGITFDTGGINLKPTGSIEDMRMDMAGAAGVLGAIKAIASLKKKVNLVAVLACAENAIGSRAVKPGEIIEAYNGKTVEILSTDAEGRLVLADALSYIEKKYKPDYMIDMATLTGAILIALGTNYAGLMTKDEKLKETILKASNETDEKVWQLPLTEIFEKDMDSDVADLRNIGKNRYGGAIRGAVFLNNFVKTAKWAHLDIAGTAWSSEVQGCNPKFATGFGVRLLTDLCTKL